MILIPVVVLQLVVGIVFVQRHYTQVTNQMATSVALELNYAADLVDEMDSVEEARAILYSLERPFAIKFALYLDQTVIPAVKSHFYDVSGRAVIDTLQSKITRDISINLVDQSWSINVRIQTSRGMLDATIPRGRIRATNPHQLLVLMVLTAIIMSVISALFLRNQVKPIRKLAEASEAFGKGQVEEFHPSGATEVRRAGYSFLAMRTRLERQIEQRTQMLLSVSHDLRTPLTRMKLSLAMIDETVDTQDMQHDVAGMEKMLDAFLSFARGDALEQAKTVNAEKMLTRVVADCRRSGREITYQFENRSSKSPKVKMREGAIARAITNLLMNALSFGEKVSLSASLSDKHLKLVVEDNGTGIPEAERENVLRPFVRLDQSRNQGERSSVGLGLAIVADVARSHGGTVRLSESETFGGLKVTLTIPR
ncbi:MAG: HAMP domain-containing sensor histidine kinase [Paracoccaceae bacterium]